MNTCTRLPVLFVAVGTSDFRSKVARVSQELLLLHLKGVRNETRPGLENHNVFVSGGRATEVRRGQKILQYSTVKYSTVKYSTVQ